MRTGFRFAVPVLVLGLAAACGETAAPARRPASRPLRTARPDAPAPAPPAAGPVAEPRPVAASPARPSAEGLTGAARLDREQVQDAFRGVVEPLVRCYDGPAATNPFSCGGPELVAEVEVAPDGSVARARIDYEPGLEPEVERCALAILRRLHFPRAAAGARVRYPVGALLVGL